MVCYFSAENLEQFETEIVAVRQRFAALRQRYIVRAWAQPRAREFAHHGFGRRLSMLMRAIDVVFALLPPDQQQEDIPSHDTVTEATMAIQAFVINASGCVDNLAWVWVHERGVQNADGTPLSRHHVGLRANNASVRASFSQHFRDYLDTREEWFGHLTRFRDALAHRVPLYIPPYIISPENLQQYNQLSAQANQCAANGDVDGYWAADHARDALGVFRPWMTNAVTDGENPVVFHAQLIADYNTVDEIGREMLDEFDRH